MDVENTPTRVEELWFSDGGLVVQAEQSLFRVSGAVLAARSPIFKDMLSSTQRPDAETIEGCPVVRLPDLAFDITCFFRAIFDSSFFESYPAEVNFLDVLSILRCSDKYGVKYLRRRALVHLSHDFPTTLSAFDALESSTIFRQLYLGDDDTSLRYITVIQLARQTNALWLLPTAFCELATTDNETIRECTTFHGLPAKLNADDERLFLTSSLHLSRLVGDVVSFLHCTDRLPCAWGDICSIARLRALAQVQTRASDDVTCFPLDLCDSADVWDGLRENCCAECYVCLEDAHARARQSIWDKLPGICKLPPWAELEKMKADALKA